MGFLSTTIIETDAIYIFGCFCVAVFLFAQLFLSDLISLRRCCSPSENNHDRYALTCNVLYWHLWVRVKCVNSCSVDENYKEIHTLPELWWSPQGSFLYRRQVKIVCTPTRWLSTSYICRKSLYILKAINKSSAVTKKINVCGCHKSVISPVCLRMRSSCALIYN